MINLSFHEHHFSTCIWSIYLSRLIRYSRACGSYQDFLDRGLLLTRKLLNPGFLFVKLKSSLWMLYVTTMAWLTAMEYLCHKWPRICSTCCKHFPVISSFMTFPEHVSSPPVFIGVFVTGSLALFVHVYAL